MAIYTKPRSEKKVADRLVANKIEVYCPLKMSLRQWSDRKKKVLVPAFPSYVFVRIEETERYQVLQDVGVLNFVYWLGKPAIIRDEEIKTIKNFLDGFVEEENQEILIEALQSNDIAIIKGGLLGGQTGKVEQAKDGQVVLLIESMGAVVRVRLNRKQVELKK